MTDIKKEVTCLEANQTLKIEEFYFPIVNQDQNKLYLFSQISKFFLLKGLCRKLSLNPQRKITRITNDPYLLFTQLRFYQNSSHYVNINIELFYFFIQHITPFVSFKMLEKIKEQNHFFNSRVGGSGRSGISTGVKEINQKHLNTFRNLGISLPSRYVARNVEEPPEEHGAPNEHGASNRNGVLNQYNFSKGVPMMNPSNPSTNKRSSSLFNYSTNPSVFGLTEPQNDPFANGPSNGSSFFTQPTQLTQPHTLYNLNNYPVNKRNPINKNQKELKTILLNEVSELIPGSTSFSLSQFSQDLWYNTPLSFKKVKNYGFNESLGNNNYQTMNSNTIDFSKRKSIFNTMTLSKLILIDRISTEILPFWSNRTDDYLNELKRMGYINTYCFNLLNTYLFNVQISTKQRLDTIVEKLEKKYPEYIGGNKNIPIRRGGKKIMKNKK
jgi:hypothetical protein